MSLGYVSTKNDFDKSGLGLREENQRLLAADGTFRAAERLDLGIGVGLSQTKALQRSTQSGGALADPDTAFWTADIKTWNEFGCATAEFQAVPERLMTSRPST